MQRKQGSTSLGASAWPQGLAYDLHHLGIEFRSWGSRLSNSNWLARGAVFPFLICINAVVGPLIFSAVSPLQLLCD